MTGEAWPNRDDGCISKKDHSVVNEAVMNDENQERKGTAQQAWLEERLFDSRIVLVGEEVTDALYRKLATTLLALERSAADKPITVLVNSPGGSADSGFAMYDLLRFTSCPVRTIANGIVASAAVLVFLAAPKGSRFTLPSARFLLHEPSTMTRGQSTDIDIAAREIVALRRRYNSIVAEATGKPLETIDRDAQRDFWLAADKAVEYGLADRMVTRRADLE
jgi:ATP-dependent Clp protease, protease subunit